MGNVVVTRRGLLITAVASIALPVLGTQRAPSAVDSRIKNPDPSVVRYDAEPIPAAVDASWRAFPAGAVNAYLANPADISTVIAMAAVVSSQKPGPVLFTNPDGTLPEASTSEIGRLQASNIVALGGEALIAPDSLQAAANAARTAATAAGHNNVTPVKTAVWQGQSASDMACVIARGLYPKGAERVYLVAAGKPTTVALAAVAGSARKGPVLVVNEDDYSEVANTIKELDPTFVVGVGELKDKTLNDLSAGRKKTLLSGSKVNVLALNIASTRDLNGEGLAVVASLDDPVSLLLGAQLATGPLVPLAPETTLTEAAKIVSSANELSHATTTRYIAIGNAGSDGKLFHPRPAQTLTGALTSADVTGKGEGTFTVAKVPAELARGTGEVFRYRLEIEDGLPVDAAAFASLLAATLNDRRGWGRNFQQVESGDFDTRIMLASADQVIPLCTPLDTHGETSCHVGDRTVINIERWAFGAAPFTEAGGSLEAYRQYVIGHEVGHALGHGHEPPTAPGTPAPVMLQQTLAMHGCLPNPWPHPENA